jgi:hypothetical protein
MLHSGTQLMRGWAADECVRVPTVGKSCEALRFSLQVPVWYDGQKAQQLMFLVGGRMEIYKGDDLIDTVEAGGFAQQCSSVIVCVCIREEYEDGDAGSMVGEFEVVLLQKCVTDCVSVEDCDVVVVDAKVRLLFSRLTTAADLLCRQWERCCRRCHGVECVVWFCVFQTVEEMMSAYPYFSVMLREVAMDRLGMYGMRELVGEAGASGEGLGLSESEIVAGFSSAVPFEPRESVACVPSPVAKQSPSGASSWYLPPQIICFDTQICFVVCTLSQCSGPKVCWSPPIHP